MGYSSAADLALRVPAATLTAFATAAGTTTAAISAAAIAAADAEIDLGRTSDWTSAQKQSASIALAVVLLYVLGGTTTPAPHAATEDAKRWRKLIDGDESDVIWNGLIYRPAADETDQQLTVQLEGP